MATTNLAGRAGRWSAAHWKTAAFGWIAFGVLIVFVSGAVGGREMEPWAIANGESRRAEQILDAGNFEIPARESVLIQSAMGDVRASIVLVRGRERRPGTVPAAERREHRLPGRAARRRPGVCETGTPCSSSSR